MQLGRRRSLPFLLSLPCPHSHLPISEREHLVCKTTKSSGVVVVVFISNKKHQMKKGSLGKKKGRGKGKRRERRERRAVGKEKWPLSEVEFGPGEEV